MAKKKIAVLVTKKNGDVCQVFVNKRFKPTLNKGKAKKFRFDRGRKKELRRWAKKRGFVKIEFFTRDNPFVVYDSTTSDGDEITGRVMRPLENRLNKVGRDIKRKLFVGEGKRSAHAQWVFRMMYLNGHGNLAARCCTRFWGKHSWGSCGKNSQSNHFPGRAADTVIMPSWSNIGTDSKAIAAMRKYGLGLPVRGENWHVEISSSFAGL